MAEQPENNEKEEQITEPTEIEKLQEEVRKLKENQNSLLDLLIPIIKKMDDRGFELMVISRGTVDELKNMKMAE